jgi:hypothetical protein
MLYFTLNINPSRNMKSFLLASLFLLSIGFVSAQSNLKVPKKARSEFQAKYEGAQGTWAKKKDVYIATFNKDGVAWSVEYNEKGTWLQTYHPVDLDKLPNEITKYIKQGYQDFELVRASYEDNSNGVYTVVVVKKGSRKLELLFDRQNRFSTENKAK